MIGTGFISSILSFKGWVTGTGVIGTGDVIRKKFVRFTVLNNTTQQPSVNVRQYDGEYPVSLTCISVYMYAETTR